MVTDDIGSAEVATVFNGRQTNSRFVTIVKLRYLTTLMVATLAVTVLLLCEASYAAQQTIEWIDELSCRYKIKFDPKKYDATRIAHTADFVFSRYLHNFPLPQGYLKPGNSGVNEYTDACTQHRLALESLDLIDLPGVEAYRRLKLDQLQDWCDFGAVLIRGTFGDVAALREYTPSAMKCSRFLDGLDGIIDIEVVWREVVGSACEKNSKPEACRSKHFAAKSEPDATDRIKSDVLIYGWQNCSARYLKTGNSVSQKAASLERELQARFETRFRTTLAPCAH